MQKTIQNPVSCFGIGVHSGQKMQVTLKPAKPNTGIVFVRTDVRGCDNVIPASYNMVFDTSLSTSIRNNALVCVSTIEHLMAAIWGCGIHNLLIEIDGPEVPIMDGSSQPFVFMIHCAGIKSQNAPSRQLKLLKEIIVNDNGCEIRAIPGNITKIDLSIDFTSRAIGKQHYVFSEEISFCEEIADSRTFGFLHELEYLQNKGLAKGASLDNAIGIDQDIVMNHEGLRYENEFVRHKLLDLLGDLFSAGGNVVGEIKAHKTSHYLNNRFLHKLFSDPYAYEWVKER